MRVCVIVLALGATAAQADSLWDHNGSVVSLEASGANRKFVYSVPRTGLPVKAGTVLFTGRRIGDEYEGTAFRFSSSCPARSYPVRGPVSSDQKKITVSGQAPRMDDSCRIVGSFQDTLVFTLQESGGGAPGDSAPPR